MNKSNGFSLIEVLVSLFVLSFGLLGVAGLLSQGMKHNSSSDMRSQASFIAYDVVERMRANRQDALDGEYAGEITSASRSAGGEQDIFYIATLLRTHLSSGVVEVKPMDGEFYEIEVRWEDPRATESAQKLVIKGRL